MQGNDEMEEIMFGIKPYLKDGNDIKTNRPYYNLVWERIQSAIQDCKKLNPESGLVELDEDAIAICRETVGYLLVKANEIKNINANNWVTFKKRAIALENLIEFSQNFGSKKKFN